MFLDGYDSLDMGVRVVVGQREIVVIKIKDVGDSGVEQHLGQWPWLTGQL